jgi:hypothetical protein
MRVVMDDAMAQIICAFLLYSSKPMMLLILPAFIRSLLFVSLCLDGILQFDTFASIRP